MSDTTTITTDVIIDNADNRVFPVTKDNGNIVTVRVRRANRREQEAADLESSRVYNQSLTGGLPPRVRMLRKLREQELWTDDDDTRLNDLRTTVARYDNQIAEKVKDLAGAEAESENSKSIAQALEYLRNQRATSFKDLNQLRVEIDSMLGHTAEARSEDIQRNFLLACVSEIVSVGPDKSVKFVARVWDSIEKLLSETDNNLLQRTIYEWMTFNAGLPSEWQPEAPVASKEKPAVKTEGEKTHAPADDAGDAKPDVKAEAA